MPRYMRGRAAVALVPADALMQRRRFCVELGLFSEAWELGRLPEEGAGWYLRGRGLQFDSASGSLKAFVVQTGAVPAVTRCLASSVGCVASPGAMA